MVNLTLYEFHLNLKETAAARALPPTNPLIALWKTWGVEIYIEIRSDLS